MANTSIVITTTRPDTNTKWIQSSPTDSSNYTEEEYNSTVLPYWQWVANLTGIISATMVYPDDLTKKTVYTFDTPENANSAWKQIHSGGGKGNPDQNPLAKARSDLSHSKMDPSRINVSLDSVSFITE